MPILFYAKNKGIGFIKELDDIFVLLKSENNANTLLTYLNSKHLNIMQNRKRQISLKLIFIEVIIVSKHQDTLNQHFLEFIPIIDL